METQDDGTKVAYTLSYTVVEDIAMLEKDGYNYTVSYSDNGEGVLETTEEDPLIITNSKTTGSVKVKKLFSGIATEQLPEDFRITASWTEGEEEVTKQLTISGENPTNVERTGEGLDYEWTISNLPLNTQVLFTESGYDVSGYQVTVNSSSNATDKTTATAVADTRPGEASFVNTYTPLTLEVTKIWEDTNGNNDVWIKDLELVLHKIGENGSEVSSYKYTVSEDRTGYTAISTDEGAPDAAVSGDKDQGYKVTFTGLDSDKMSYYVTEVQMDGYETVYSHRDSEGKIQSKPKGAADASRANDGEYIVNRPYSSYVLPATGGEGTRRIYLISLTLLLLAGAFLIFRRRRIENRC